MTEEEFIIADISNRGDFDDWYFYNFMQKRGYPVFEELDIAEQLYLCDMFKKELSLGY